MAIVIVWEEPEPEVHGSGGGSSKPSAFDLTPKAPAGQRSDQPNFNLYLGANTGSYNFTSANGTVILPPIPIEWIVAPTNVTLTDGQCPSRTQNLGLFGVTNAVVLALVLVFGCRPLVRLLTGGILGSPGRWSPYWTWVLSFGMQVCSNVIVSRMIVTTPGYEHLSMLNVFALYSSRPRVNQFWTGLLRLWVGPITLRGRMMLKEKVKPVKKERSWRLMKPGTWILRETTVGWRDRITGKKKEEGEEKEKGGVVAADDTQDDNKNTKMPAKPTTTTAPRYQYDEYLEWRKRWVDDPLEQYKSEPRANAARAIRTGEEFVTRAQREREEKQASEQEEWIYTDSYVSTSVGEFFVQLLSAIFIGITWHRFPNEPIKDHMKHWLNLMMAAPAMSLLGWVVIPVWFKRGRAVTESKCLDFMLMLVWFVVPGFLTYGVAWKYWDEFLMLPGSLWCPPKFAEQAAVWSSFSALSSFLGTIL
ncbi:hypothetical protein B0H66DRAFT_376669 [Apodospora peruviana]|uniref:Uncharacterized protein n=1 Tax=Apodospora peruviana TaxID=516989 RepID=A0AAE0HWW4_9PEZI|nr:hypothetical protein B0H66DRAFT_376669 [Apodospora peruviana]